MWLSKETFKDVVTHTPLISIDLIVKNESEQVLLGQRQNRPAQNFWFVPGGRVRKNESLDDAFMRLTQEELGLTLYRHQAHWLGVYQHFYEDSVFGGEDAPSTHYIVLAYQLTNISNIGVVKNDQHEAFQWWDIDKLQYSSEVHQYTKDYFNFYTQEK